MRKIWYGAFATALLLGSVSFVLADPFSNPGVSTTPQPFSITCDPYTAPFVDGVPYMPSGSICAYTLPQTGSYKVVGIYKGTIGNSVPVQRGFTISNPASVVEDTGYNFSDAQLGDGYFAASYSSDSFSDVISTDSYLQNSASGIPTPDLTTVSWIWGVTPPISISVPLPGHSYFPSDTLIPLANIANLASYSSVIYTLNGSPVDPTQPLPIAAQQPGMATLVIAATDGTGTTLYATSTFMIVDQVPPVIAITKPVDGHSYLQNDNLPIVATITDASAIATTTYQLNGVPVDPTLPLPLMSQPLGTATLVVSSADIYGNTGYATSTFTVLPPDLTAPTVTITSPTVGATYTDATNIFLTASVTDASPIAATSYTFNGTTIDPTLPLPLLTAPLGPASVSVAATDAYGNAASTTVNFVIKSSDVTPPTITITNPIAGHTYLSTASVLATATITDASGVSASTYTLDGLPVDPSLPLPLALAGAGPAILVVTATDNFGNTSSSSVSFKITTPTPPDTQAPVVTITNPVAGKKYTRKDSVLLTSTITDQSPIANVRYYFNGKIIDQTKPLPFKNAPLGNATVSVIATDSYGNVGSSTLKFRITPSDDSCIADITEAFDHKWIPTKQGFKEAFDDCKKISDREHDRDDYDNDNHKKNRDSHTDDRYIKAQKDVDDAFSNIDKCIQN